MSLAANARTEIIPQLPVDTLFDSTYRPGFAARPDFFGHIDYGRSDLDDRRAHPEGYVDDDEDSYVEYLITLPIDPGVDHPRADLVEAAVVEAAVVEAAVVDAAVVDAEIIDAVQYAAVENSDTEPLATRVAHPRPASEPIGLAHNGFHVDHNDRFQPLSAPSTMTVDPLADGFDRLADRIDTFSASFTELMDRQHDSLSDDFAAFGGAPVGDADGPSRHRMADNDAVQYTGRHYRNDPDDTLNYGRHSSPRHD